MPHTKYFLTLQYDENTNQTKKTDKDQRHKKARCVTENNTGEEEQVTENNTGEEEHDTENNTGEEEHDTTPKLKQHQKRS